MKNLPTRESLQKKALWLSQRTPSIFSDDKSLYRALVECWGYSLGPNTGDVLDEQLDYIVEPLVDELCEDDLIRIGDFDETDWEDEREKK